MFTIVNKSTKVTDADVKTMVRAVAHQVRYHACPIYGLIPVPVVFATTAEVAPPGSFAIAILDNSDQAGTLGWHTEGAGDVIYGEVFARPVLDHGGNALTSKLSVASVLSHEVLETLCLAPNMRVLTSDLRWIPVGEVKEGDFLVGFDEESGGQGRKRRYASSRVEAAPRVIKDSIELTMEDGSVLTCSEDHRWLVNNGGRAHWVAAKDLIAAEPTPDARGRARSTGKNASRIVKPLDVWGESGYVEGYLGGIYDGEGSLTQHVSSSGDTQMRLSIGQNDNPAQVLIEQYLKESGYRFTDTIRPAGSGDGVKRYSTDHRVFYLSKKRDVIRLLGSARPARLLGRLNLDRLGCMLTDSINAPRVLKKRRVGQQEVVALRTSTRTFIAEGFASHNCDPHANLWADDGKGTSYAYELCDAVESDSYPITVDGVKVMVSNFVTPHWFDPLAKAGEQLDYLRKTTRPFQMTPGGYVITMTSGTVSQSFGEKFPDWRKEFKSRPGADRRLTS